MKKIELLYMLSIIAAVSFTIASFITKNPIDCKLFTGIALVSFASSFKFYNHQNK